MDSIAELRNVTKMFGERKALDDVSFQIKEGEILGLLGPNGSGKTTLLRILAFLFAPSSGEVYFKGEKVTDANAERIRMESTMVFQKTTLFTSTVYDNVAYGLRIRKANRETIEDEVSNALELSRLSGFEKRQARKLSGGEQQRVALARALVLKTRLLLLDEPTANLDPKNASITEEVIMEINRRYKTTVVMATHNMFQAKSLPQRIALIENGKIGETGTPTEVFGKLSTVLASFAAMENTFTGDARRMTDGTSVVDIGGNVQIVTATKIAGRASLFISPDDIIISKTKFDSSARNLIQGQISEISDLNSVVKLKIDAGKTFTVHVTKRSFEQMGLNIGSKVFLTFKASSVQIF